METHMRTTGYRLTIWVHTTLLAIRHKRTHPALIPAGEGWLVLNLPTPEGWKAETLSQKSDALTAAPPRQNQCQTALSCHL